MVLTDFGYFMADISSSLIAAFVGFLLALWSYDWNKNRIKKDRKKEIASHMKTEVKELIETIEDPKSVFKDFIPQTWNPTKKMFEGENIVLELTAHEYIKNPEIVGMFSYKTVDTIANVKLDLEEYAQVITEKGTFHYKVASLNEKQTKDFLDLLIGKEELEKKTLLAHLNELKDLLGTIN